MRINKRLLIFTSVAFLALAATAYASSSNFFAQAQKYIDQKCNQKTITNQTALLCYLFNKSQEQDATIASLSATLSPIPGQIANIQATLTPIPGQIAAVNTTLSPIPSEINDLKKKIQDLQNNQPPQPTDFTFLSGVFPATGGTTSPIFDAQGYTKIAFTWNCPVGATPILLETSPDQILWGVQIILGNAQQCLDSSVTLNTARRYYKVVLGGSTNFTSITVNAFGHFFN